MRPSRLAALLALALLLGAAPGARADGGPPPSVLIVVPHPDDESMMGDVLGRMKERGFRVTMAVITNGESGQIVGKISSQVEPGVDPLVEHRPGVETARLGIATPADLARARQRELEVAARRHGIREVVLLSDPDGPEFADDYDGGVTSWNRARLRTLVGRVARRVRPDVVITMNPGASWIHPQHRGVGEIVSSLYGAGDLTTGQRAPALYAIREHDWYERSARPQVGDETYDRTRRSAPLGRSYGEQQAHAAAAYGTQPVTPEANAARARAGLVPGYQEHGLLRRLDSGPAPGLPELFRAHEPSRARARSRRVRVTRLHRADKRGVKGRRIVDAMARARTRTRNEVTRGATSSARRRPVQVRRRVPAVRR